MRRLAPLLVLSGATALVAQERTSIEGRLLSGPRRGEVVLQRVDRERNRHREVARVELDGGRLAVEFIQPAPALYRLLLPKNRGLEVVLWPGQKLVFDYDPKTAAFSSTGSPQTEEFQRGVALDRDSLVAFLATLESPLAVYALFTLHGWNDKVGDYDLSAVAAVHRRLAAADPKAPGIEPLADVLQRYRRTAVGAVLPDAILKDPDGRTIKLSDLHGRHVLVDIWVSGCVPCRRASPDLLATYERYKDSGFTIYSISFDDRRDVWMKAIKKDRRDWPYHVSDLRGARSEASYVYAAAPPASFLLDPEGRVLAKNLDGEALGRELEKVFGF